MAVLAAFGAALFYGVASVLQQRSAARAPAERHMRVGLLVGLVRNPTWIAGILADGGGFVLQFIALDHGSLVLVQPLLVSGLLFALPLGSALDKRRLTGLEWLGSIVTVVGLSLFLVVASPASGSDEASTTASVTTGICTLVPIALMIGLSRSTTGAVKAGLLAASGGIFYGLAAALTKVTAQDLHGGIAATVATWEPYALVICAVVSLVVVQSAFQAGPLRWSLPILTVVDPVVSIMIGAFALGERISTAGIAPGVETAGLVAMALGVFMLAREPGLSTERTTVSR